MAEHVTFFRAKVLPGKRDATIEQFNRWEREQKPKAAGFIRSILVANNNNPDEIMAAVRWDNTENYMKNSDRPEQGAWFQELRANFAADPEWFDGTLIREASA